MKVTVMSPVTADVTIAQAEKWLERSGWERYDPGAPGTWYDTWAKSDGADAAVAYVPTSHPDPPESMAELINDVASAMGDTPAHVLREMSEVRL